eukprot:1755608-Pyramimonas_sp.AAC.1
MALGSHARGRGAGPAEPKSRTLLQCHASYAADAIPSYEVTEQTHEMQPTCTSRRPIRRGGSSARGP